MIQFRTLHGLVQKTVRQSDLALYHYLKYLSKLDLAASMKPQSGVFSIIVKEEEWFCRFSALETFSAKSGVLRILNLSKIKSLDDVSIQDDQINKLRNALNQENGLILFSGTTGSGKSTTLFSALSEIRNRSIYTLEDPIECLYHNMMQIQINEANQFDFQAGIKQLLRHDPDIIVIGEIRSPLEAQALFRISLSGHLVCSTIHSSSACQTVNRLIDFDIDEEELKMVNLTIVFQTLEIHNKKRSAQLEVITYQELIDSKSG